MYVAQQPQLSSPSAFAPTDTAINADGQLEADSEGTQLLFALHARCVRVLATTRWRRARERGASGRACGYWMVEGMSGASARAPRGTSWAALACIPAHAHACWRR